MPSPASSEFPRPSNSQDFERICAGVFKNRWRDPDVQRYGRSGQKQNGVDIYGVSAHIGQRGHVGVQCKRVNELSLDTIKDEIAKAESFRPRLKLYVVATTLSRDAKLTEALASLSDARVSTGDFPVRIVFWEDLCADLAEDQALLSAHYPSWAGVAGRGPALTLSWASAIPEWDAHVPQSTRLALAAPPPAFLAEAPAPITVKDLDRHIRANPLRQRVRSSLWADIERYNREVRSLGPEELASWRRSRRAERMFTYGELVCLVVGVANAPARSLRLDVQFSDEIDVARGDHTIGPALPLNPLEPAPGPVASFAGGSFGSRGALDAIRLVGMSLPRVEFLDGQCATVKPREELLHNLAHYFFYEGEALLVSPRRAGEFRVGWEARMSNCDVVQSGELLIDVRAAQG